MEVIAIPGFSEPFSSLSHLGAALLAFTGVFYLCRKGWGNHIRVLSLLVFSFALIFLFSMSGVYHLLEPGFTPRNVLQRLDHAAIWVLIAGTFTPVHMILFRGIWRWGILIVVWTIAVTGLVLEVVFFESIPEWLSLLLYLSLGWIGVLTSRHFNALYSDASIKLLWMGGIFYSLGAVLDWIAWPVLIPGILGAHEMFHIFVVIAAIQHWLFIYKWAHYPTRRQITFHVSEFPGSKYIAEAVGELIWLEAESREALHEKIRETIASKFKHYKTTNSVRLRYSREEIL